MQQDSNFKIYVDESGNSGKNLLDSKQPFFTLGAVVIAESQLAEIQRFTDAIPNPLKDEYGEAKGNNVASYDQRLALKIVGELLPGHAEMFFFSVLEKKFMIAGQIVEHFFDFYYNDKTDESWTQKSNLKIELANFFYENLSDEAIANVHESFVNPDVINIRSSFDQIRSEIKNVEYKFDVELIMSGAELHLKSLSDSIQLVNKKNTVAKRIPKNTISTPNVTTFFELICRVEKYLASRSIKSILVFDSSEQFNRVYETLLRRMILAKKAEIAISSRESIQFGFEQITDFTTGNSKQFIGLQLVDFLTSIVNHVFAKIIRKEEKELTKEDLQLVGLVFIYLNQSPIGYLVVSDEVKKRFGEVFMSLSRSV